MECNWKKWIWRICVSL